MHVCVYVTPGSYLLPEHFVTIRVNKLWNRRFCHFICYLYFDAHLPGEEISRGAWKISRTRRCHSLWGRQQNVSIGSKTIENLKLWKALIIRNIEARRLNKKFSEAVFALLMLYFGSDLVSQSTIPQVSQQIHQPVSQIHHPLSQIHPPVSQIHQPVSKIHQPVSKIHQPVSQIQQPVNQIHQPGRKFICQSAKFNSQSVKFTSQLAKFISQSTSQLVGSVGHQCECSLTSLVFTASVIIYLTAEYLSLFLGSKFLFAQKDHTK